VIQRQRSMKALPSTDPRSFASLEADTNIPWRSVGAGETASGSELVLHWTHILELSFDRDPILDVEHVRAGVYQDHPRSPLRGFKILSRNMQLQQL
jgi:hypothetical protein